jgi:hypothetical protein
MLREHDPPNLQPWPVPTPADLYDIDMRAQIWRYDPVSGSWQRVFISPWASPKIPRDIGYRAMAVFQSTGDQMPALYVCTWSPSRAKVSPTIMRSRDGVEFVALPSINADPSLNSYRILLPFRDMLLTSPTGRVRGKQNVSNNATVLATTDPATKPWRPVSGLGFGDPHNLTCFEMTSFNDWLYVGTLNAQSGFQIWKSRLDTQPCRWHLVICNGADRGPANEAAFSMCVFGNALYVGTGIQHGGYDRTHDVGPAASELIRIYPDDSWDIVVGEPRLTGQGYKYSISGMGPGFDEFFNSYFWRMAVHDGWLYVGTYKWGALLPYVSRDHWPQWLRSTVAHIGIDEIARAHGGCDVWRTRNGIDWFAVTVDGFNNMYNWGARTLCSSPHGLFVGTANPFGPEVAAMAPDGWRYAPNPKGGLEIWLGRANLD